MGAAFNIGTYCIKLMEILTGKNYMRTTMKSKVQNVYLLSELMGKTAAIIFRVILFTTGSVFNKLFSQSFFNRENNALFSGSKIGEIPKICKQRKEQGEPVCKHGK